MLQLEEAQANLIELFKKAQEEAVPRDPNELFKRLKPRSPRRIMRQLAETLGSYIKIPKVKLLQDATFLRGDCYFRIKQYKKAIIETQSSRKSSRGSPHMPEALYKIGVSFEALGMKEDAKGFYQELVEKYPKSPEAKKIRKKAR